MASDAVRTKLPPTPCPPPAAAAIAPRPGPLPGHAPAAAGVCRGATLAPHPGGMENRPRGSLSLPLAVCALAGAAGAATRLAGVGLGPAPASPCLCGPPRTAAPAALRRAGPQAEQASYGGQWASRAGAVPQPCGSAAAATLAAGLAPARLAGGASPTTDGEETPAGLGPRTSCSPRPILPR